MIRIINVMLLVLLMIGCGEPNNGVNGSDGRNGKDGRDGQDGESCAVISVSNGARIQCPDGSETVVLHGTNGINGTNALPSAYTVTEIIDPCGDDAGHFDEVILKTSNGTLLAHYVQGNKQFLVILSAGIYETTDWQRCEFEVTVDGDVIW
jgi:hypothetical protein